MEQPPNGGWFLHNGCLLLSMAVLNSPTRPLGQTEGHLQYRPTSLHSTTSLSLPLILLSSRSHGVICATVSFDHPFGPNADFTILHIDSLRQNRH